MRKVKLLLSISETFFIFKINFKIDIFKNINKNLVKKIW